VVARSLAIIDEFDFDVFDLCSRPSRVYTPWAGGVASFPLSSLLGVLWDGSLRY
jgi:hypothetical protein